MCLKDLSDVLDENYIRVLNDLRTPPLHNKVDILIYANLNTYHKASYQPNAPTWVIANSVLGKDAIQMVNPLHGDGRSYDEYMKAIVHEFTHIIVMRYINSTSNIPIWLNEGIASYEAKQDDDAGPLVSTAKLMNTLPTLKELETNNYTFGNNNGYQFSYSIIEYIVKVYGYDKVVALVKSPAMFEKIIGMSKQDFQKVWASD